MGRFDEIERRADYEGMERIGDSRQSDKLPMKDEVDRFKVKKELDTVNPDLLINQCKREKDGEKHVLLMFYSTSDGRQEWIPVAMPKYYLRKTRKKGWFEVVDVRNGRRKTFARNSVKTVKKQIDRNTGKWVVYKGEVDKARFK